MPQAIDSAKLKAAAEYLEWVLAQYSDSDDVQHLRRGLQTLIDDAKVQRIGSPIIDSNTIPFQWSVLAEGSFRKYNDPDIGQAYADFVTELAGGLTDEEKQIISGMSSTPERN